MLAIAELGGVECGFACYVAEGRDGAAVGGRMEACGLWSRKMDWKEVRMGVGRRGGGRGARGMGRRRWGSGRGGGCGRLCLLGRAVLGGPTGFFVREG